MATVKKRRRKVGTDAAGKARYRDEGYQVRFVDPDGVERLRVFPKKADADRFAVEVEHRKLSGLYIDPAAGRVTFREYAETWRVAQAHRPNTVSTLQSRLEQHVYPFIGDRPIASIRRTELQGLIRQRADVVAPATLENIVAWVRTIFRAAVDDRIITVSPAARVRLPAAPVKAPIEPLPLEMVERLAAAMPPRLRAMVVLGVGTGVRSGEALGVTVDRVDFLRRKLTIDRQLVTIIGSPPMHAPPKTAAGNRVIPLPNLVTDALAAHLAEFEPGELGGLLFTMDGRPIRRNKWSGMWADAVAAVGLPKGTRFHVLRHTYASMLIRAGCSVKVVQARLGHATAQETLDTYAHLWPDDEDRTRDAVDETFEQHRETHDGDVGEA